MTLAVRAAEVLAKNRVFAGIPPGRAIPDLPNVIPADIRYPAHWFACGPQPRCRGRGGDGRESRPMGASRTEVDGLLGPIAQSLTRISDTGLRRSPCRLGSVFSRKMLLRQGQAFLWWAAPLTLSLLPSGTRQRRRRERTCCGAPQARGAPQENQCPHKRETCQKESYHEQQNHPLRRRRRSRPRSRCRRSVRSRSCRTGLLLASGSDADADAGSGSSCGAQRRVRGRRGLLLLQQQL